MSYWECRRAVLWEDNGTELGERGSLEGSRLGIACVQVPLDCFR